MKIDVFDTYVTHEDGVRLHFDVLLPQGGSNETAVQYAMQWLSEIGIKSDNIQLDKCRYCHSEAAYPEIEETLKAQGYFILQMEGCPAPVH